MKKKEEYNWYRFVYIQNTYVDLKFNKEEINRIFDMLNKGTKYLQLNDDFILNLDKVFFIRKFAEGEFHGQGCK